MNLSDQKILNKKSIDYDDIKQVGGSAQPDQFLEIYFLSDLLYNSDLRYNNNGERVKFRYDNDQLNYHNEYDHSELGIVNIKNIDKFYIDPFKFNENNIYQLNQLIDKNLNSPTNFLIFIKKYYINFSSKSSIEQNFLPFLEILSDCIKLELPHTLSLEQIRDKILNSNMYHEYNREKKTITIAQKLIEYLKSEYNLSQTSIIIDLKNLVDLEDFMKSSSNVMTPFVTFKSEQSAIVFLENSFGNTSSPSPSPSPSQTTRTRSPSPSPSPSREQLRKLSLSSEATPDINTMQLHFTEDSMEELLQQLQNSNLRNKIKIIKNDNNNYTYKIYDNDQYDRILKIAEEKSKKS
jgi:hypothetical protein